MTFKSGDDSSSKQSVAEEPPKPSSEEQSKPSEVSSPDTSASAPKSSTTSTASSIKKSMESVKAKVKDQTPSKGVLSSFFSFSKTKKGDDGKSSEIKEKIGQGLKDLKSQMDILMNLHKEYVSVSKKQDNYISRDIDSAFTQLSILSDTFGDRNRTIRHYMTELDSHPNQRSVIWKIWSDNIDEDPSFLEPLMNAGALEISINSVLNHQLQESEKPILFIFLQKTIHPSIDPQIVYSLLEIVYQSKDSIGPNNVNHFKDMIHTFRAHEKTKIVNPKVFNDFNKKIHTMEGESEENHKNSNQEYTEMEETFNKENKSITDEISKMENEIASLGNESDNLEKRIKTILERKKTQEVLLEKKKKEIDGRTISRRNLEERKKHTKELLKKHQMVKNIKDEMEKLDESLKKVAGDNNQKIQDLLKENNDLIEKSKSGSSNLDSDQQASMIDSLKNSRTQTAELLTQLEELQKTTNDEKYTDQLSALGKQQHEFEDFHTDGAGVNEACGYTYDGHAIDYTSGELASPLHNFSAPSKESIHLGMLALALLGDTDNNGYSALDFFHNTITKTPMELESIPSTGNQNLDNVLTILTRKITTYENFNAQFPGYGGYMPWVGVNDTGIYPLPDWSGRVPGLDNGEMIWGIYAVYNILNQNPSYSALGQRYQNYFNLLISNAKMMFYVDTGYISAVTAIKNIYAQPSPSNYQNDCNCYLDDPYEGELLTVFMDLYCEWDSDDQRDQIWINKRALLQQTQLTTPKGDITVQKGWWFSSHELWPKLMLPYLSVPINRAVFENGERARTWFSFLHQYPGLFASVTNVTTPGVNPNYMSATGIQEIAFEQIETNDVMTPYGSFPLFLVNQSLGLSWYHNMLSGPSMQNPYGSTESVNNQGTEISPVITWDSKETTVLAMMGGLADINQQFLDNDEKLDRFQYVINREWSLVFPDPLSGTDLPFMYPQESIPLVLNDLTSCN
eukprot:gene11343-13890_t